MPKRGRGIKGLWFPLPSTGLRVRLSSSRLGGPFFCLHSSTPSKYPQISSLSPLFLYNLLIPAHLFVLCTLINLVDITDHVYQQSCLPPCQPPHWRRKILYQPHASDRCSHCNLLSPHNRTPGVRRCQWLIPPHAPHAVPGSGASTSSTSVSDADDADGDYEASGE